MRMRRSKLLPRLLIFGQRLLSTIISRCQYFLTFCCQEYPRSHVWTHMYGLVHACAHKCTHASSFFQLMQQFIFFLEIVLVLLFRWRLRLCCSLDWTDLQSFSWPKQTIGHPACLMIVLLDTLLFFWLDYWTLRLSCDQPIGHFACLLTRLLDTVLLFSSAHENIGNSAFLTSEWFCLDVHDPISLLKEYLCSLKHSIVTYTAETLCWTLAGHANRMGRLARRITECNCKRTYHASCRACGRLWRRRECASISSEGASAHPCVSRIIVWDHLCE